MSVLKFQRNQSMPKHLYSLESQRNNKVQSKLLILKVKENFMENLKFYLQIEDQYHAYIQQQKIKNIMTKTLSKRKNQKISFETRQELVRLVSQDRKTIKQAGRSLGLKKSTAKMIVNKFKKNGFMTKFKLQKVNEKTERAQEQKIEDSFILQSIQNINRSIQQQQYPTHIQFTYDDIIQSKIFWMNCMPYQQYFWPQISQTSQIQFFYI